MLTSRVLGAVVAGTADIRDSPSTEAAERGLLAQVAAIDRPFAIVLSVDIAAARAGPGIRARPHRVRGKGERLLEQRLIYQTQGGITLT